MNAPQQVGELLGGRYRLGERLATGGMGEVWAAQDETLGRSVAVKILKPEYAGDADFRNRFRSEARHAAGIGHPGVAHVHDYGEADGTSYLVMELVSGEPLSAVLAREGRLTPERTLDLVRQVADALEAAHAAGVIHRDVKPGNIMVTPSGAVKVTDFGIARATAHTTVTQTGVVLGTAHYLSPEQASGRDVTPASDVYSLGVVAYECLAGQRPFTGDTPVAIATAHCQDPPPPLPPDVPEPVATLVGQALAKEPAERFRSAAAFGRAAEATLAGLDHTATKVLPPVPAPAPARNSRRRTFVAVATAVLAVLTLVGGAVAWKVTHPPKQAVPDLSRLSRSIAIGTLRSRSFEAVLRYKHDPGVPADRVISQDPAPLTRLREGSRVTITISTGPETITLPPGLTGHPYDAVASVLRSLKLVPRPAYRSSDTQPGTVIAVSPDSGLHPGDAVTVTVAAEPEREHGRGKGKRDGND